MPLLKGVVQTPLHLLEQVLRALMMWSLMIVAGSWVLANVIYRRGLRWTWAWLGLPAGWVVFHVAPLLALPVWCASLLACMLGARWHHSDISRGGDFAQAAHSRLGVIEAVRRRQAQVRIKDGGWVRGGMMAVGRDGKGWPVWIPVGEQSGSHMLVLGATGSGKTVSTAWVTGRLIDGGHAAIVIDPKGDRLLRSELVAAAARRQVPFLEWTPEGPLAYNPYATGTASEIADKALSGEQFTEPHYLRQAQRYLGHTIKIMHAASTPVTPVSLMAHLDPRELEVATRALPEEKAQDTVAYLDSLSDRQQRELSGVRDRLSILAESDICRWLDPKPDENAIDLRDAVRERAVVYFRLDSDRRPLIANMLGAAIVSDLITLVAHLQATPEPAVVAIDEFAAIAAENVARLFGRARSAGISLVLGTQELADLRSVGDGALREQTLGNVQTVIAHRQNVPESAELIAALAGSKAAWITTEQTEEAGLGSGPSGRGSRRRGYEFEIHPSRIKQLKTGQAAVITPGTNPPAITNIHHPSEAHQ